MFQAFYSEGGDPSVSLAELYWQLVEAIDVAEGEGERGSDEEEDEKEEEVDDEVDEADLLTSCLAGLSLALAEYACDDLAVCRSAQRLNISLNNTSVAVLDCTGPARSCRAGTWSSRPASPPWWTPSPPPCPWTPSVWRTKSPGRCASNRLGQLLYSVSWL